MCVCVYAIGGCVCVCVCMQSVCACERAYVRVFVCGATPWILGAQFFMCVFIPSPWLQILDGFVNDRNQKFIDQCPLKIEQRNQSITCAMCEIVAIVTTHHVMCKIGCNFRH